MAFSGGLGVCLHCVRPLLPTLDCPTHHITHSHKRDMTCTINMAEKLPLGARLKAITIGHDNSGDKPGKLHSPLCCVA